MNAPHLDVDELADAEEGLLTPSRAAEIEAHLDGCSECTQLLTAVRAVPALLADVPSPPMPSQTAARLDAVLRTEATRRKTDAGARSVPATPIPVRRQTGTWGERHPRLRLTAAAAATVAVIGGGSALIGSQNLSDDGTADSSSAGAAEQMDRSREPDAAGGQAGSTGQGDEESTVRLDALARRLRALERVGAVEGLNALDAAAASVQGLRVGMTAS